MKLFAMFIVVAVVMAGSLPVNAQVELQFNPTDQDGPFTVSSERARFDRATGTTSFIGSVVITREALTLTCDEAIVYTSESDRSEVESILVIGNVVMNNEDGEATAQEGEYLLQEALIRLSGGVRIATADFTLVGPEFTYDIETGLATLDEGAAADVNVPDE